MAKSAKKTKPSSKSILVQLRESESSASIIFGAIVVIVVGILLFNYTRSNRLAMLSEKGGTTEVAQTSETGITLPSTHTVVAGDHLWKIAEKFYGNGLNWVDIAAVNNLREADGLRVGMILAIPVATMKTAPSVPAEVTLSAPADMTISGATYQVQAGDSLWKIAVRAYGDGYKWTSILVANKQIIKNANVLHVGWTLTLPR